MQAVRDSRDLPGLPSFEHEELRAAARRRTAGASQVSLPTGPHTFGSFRPWEGIPADAFPSAAHALKLLHRLAADRGIVGIMTKHKWMVGMLSEMPPEGKVGVSPVCVLGVNINAGQEISLRLRTDDLKGFRRFQKIRETLIHELTHNVWSDHDHNFKQLNSQLLREAMDWTSQPGRTTGGYAASDDEDAAVLATPPPTAQSLGGGSAGVPPSAAAAAAALQRSNQAQARAAEAAAAAAAAAAATTQADGAIAGMGHRDHRTEAAEDAAALLGGSAAAASGDTHAASQPSDACSAEPEAPEAASASHAQRSSHQHLPKGAAESGSTPTGMGSDSKLQQPASAAATFLMPMDIEGDSAGSQPAAAASSGRMEMDTPAATPVEPQQHGASELQPDILQQHDPSELQPDISEDVGQLGIGSASSTADAISGSGGSVGSRPASGGGLPPGEGADVQQRYQRVQQAVAELVARPPQQRQLALSSLQTILQNALGSSDPKFRRVRQGNPAFQSRLGQFPEAVEVMKVAGFVEETEPESVLVLKRDDPGLLWLTLSAVKDSMVH